MKKTTLIISVILALTLTIFVLSASVEETPITVTLDGEEIDCLSYGQAPVIVDGRTLVPLRAIFEALGATVEWNETTREITSTLDGVTVKLEIGKKIIYRNDAVYLLDVPAEIRNGRTLVPVRAISESFGVIVDWDAKNRNVILLTEAPEEIPEKAEEPEEDKSESVKPVSTKPDKPSDDEETEDFSEQIHAFADFYLGMSKSQVKKIVSDNLLNETNSLLEAEYTVSDNSITGDLEFETVTFSFEDGVLYSFEAKSKFVSDSYPLMKSLLTAAVHYGDDSVYDEDNKSYTWEKEDKTVVCRIERTDDKQYRFVIEIEKN